MHLDAATAGLAWRYERKFAATGLSLAQVELVIKCHPALFREIHAPRWVNNVYLDDPGLTRFHANEDGLAERDKVRIRWYGELRGVIERPVLERKLKRGWAGSKLQAPLARTEVSFPLRLDFSRDLIARSALDSELRAVIDGLQISLVNRYLRRYYASADGRFRLTVDRDIAFLDGARTLAQGTGRARHSWMRPGRHAWPAAIDELQRGSSEIIVELKYAVADDLRADTVAGALPFRVSRSSKYATGIRRLRGLPELD